MATVLHRLNPCLSGECDPRYYSAGSIRIVYCSIDSFGARFWRSVGSGPVAGFLHSTEGRCPACGASVHRHLRRYAAMARAAFSRGPASVFSARQYHRYGRLLEGGSRTPAVTHYYLLSLPVTVPTVLLRGVINHRLHGDAF